MYEAMAILAGFVFLYSLLAGALERTPVNGALVFAGFGLLFGALAKEHKPKLPLAAQGTGETLGLITRVVFGAAVVGQSLDSFSWQIVLYAVLSLTIVRMLPVFLVLRGMNLRTGEKLFLGWFGPRGRASIVFAVIVLNANLPGGEVIAMTAVCTILVNDLLRPSLQSLG